MPRRALTLSTFVVLSACGGAGSPSLPVASLAPVHMQSATFTIRIPQASSPSSLRPSYVSANTHSLRIALTSVNGSAPVPAVPDVVAALTPTSPGCSNASGNTVCTVSTPAVIGNDSYTLSLYQSTDGSGSALSTATVSTTVTQGVATNVPVSLNGVIASIAFSQPVLSAGADGNVHTFSVTLSALDASGATIIAPGAFTAPITLSIANDPHGAVGLSSTSISSPSSTGSIPLTVTYDSSKALAYATITASSGSISSQTLVAPINASVSSLRKMMPGTQESVTLSEPLYSGRFSASVTPGIVGPYTCVPVSCTPATQGGSLTMTFTGSSPGQGTATIQDTYGGSIALPIGVGAASASTPVTAASIPTVSNFSIASNPTGDIYLGGGNPSYYFDPRSCCTLVGFVNSYPTNGDLLYLQTTNILYELNSGIVTISGCPSTCSLAKLATLPSGFYQFLGGDNAIWVTNFTPTVYRVIPGSGVSTTLNFGSSVNFMTATSDGTMYFTDNGDASIGHFNPAGCSSTCTISRVSTVRSGQNNGITTDNSGGAWIAERGPYIAHVSCAATCSVSEFALGATFSNPSFIMMLPDGLLYVNDVGNSTFALIDPATCSTTTNTCYALFHSSSGYGAYWATIGSDGSLWAITTTRNVFRYQIP